LGEVPLKVRRYIVRGQGVQPVVLEAARAMRREMTPEERLVWERLRDSKLGVKFRRQQVISRFVADFYCHAAGLIVEVDGSQHSPEVDAERDAALRALRLRLLRFSNRGTGGPGWRGGGDTRCNTAGTPSRLQHCRRV
jgi:very-short-patch-repair endonuclease